MENLQEYLLQLGCKDAETIERTSRLYRKVLIAAMDAADEIFDRHENSPLALMVVAEALKETVRAEGVEVLEARQRKRKRQQQAARRLARQTQEA